MVGSGFGTEKPEGHATGHFSQILFVNVRSERYNPMARVRAFKIGGIEMWFPSGDHEPPHFHARRPGEWCAKVYIQEPAASMIELVRPPGATIKGGDRKAIVGGVEANRAELLWEWEQAQG
jgi:hypothetical protein